jgi:hypothetical protein
MTKIINCTKEDVVIVRKDGTTKTYPSECQTTCEYQYLTGPKRIDNMPTVGAYLTGIHGLPSVDDNSPEAEDTWFIVETVVAEYLKNACGRMIVPLGPIHKNGILKGYKGFGWVSNVPPKHLSTPTELEELGIWS